MTRDEPAVQNADGPAVQKGPTIVSSTTYELGLLKKELDKARETIQGLQQSLEKMTEKGSFDAWQIGELNKTIQGLEVSVWPQHQELMMARDWHAAAMRDNAGIRSEFRGMREHIDALRHHNSDLIVRCYLADQVISGYLQYIRRLEDEIYLWRRSLENNVNPSGAMAADLTTLKMATNWYQEQLRAVNGLNQSLDAKTRKLLNQTKHMRARLKEADIDASAMRIRKQGLQRSLQEAQGRLKIIETQASGHIRARDEVQKDLDLATQKLGKTMKVRKKPVKTKVKVTAKDEAARTAVEKGLEDEISRLTGLLKEKDNDIQEQKTTMEELRASIKTNADEQESIQLEEDEEESNSQTVVAVEEMRLPIDDEVTEVKEHSKIDEWYVEESTPADELARLRQELQDARDEVLQLNEMVKCLDGVIKEQKTEIRRRRQNETTLQAEADRQGAMAAESQRQLQTQRARVAELERLQTRANLKLIGSGLLVIEAMVRDRTLLVQHVLETVAGRLDAIDSAPSANRAFKEIDGFLENVTGHLMGCIQQAMLDAAAVNGVVRNMRLLLPGLADKIDQNGVSRLYGEVQMFKTEVEGLLGGIKQELAGAGAGAGAIARGGGAMQKNMRKKEAPKDRPLWLGFQPDQLVFPSSLKSERKKMTLAVNMVSQLIVAMAGFWFVDRLCVWFKLSDTVANLHRACICVVICSIAVRSAQPAERRLRTRDRAAATKTGPLTHK